LICQGQTTQLCATSGCAKYLWSTGATTSCITVSTAGTYTVTITNAAGCTSTCSKTVTVSAPIVCSITGDTSICQGQTTQLCAPSGCAKYLWSTGATTSCITVGTAGTYTVTITNAAGCTSTCSKTVTILAAPDCTITGPSSCDLGTSIQLCAPAGYTKYLWNTGATTNCIEVTQGGTYSVTVSNAAGCTATASKYITSPYITTGQATPDTINQTAKQEIRISDAPLSVSSDRMTVKAYPNPFTGKAVIEFRTPGANAHVVVELYDINGVKILTLFDKKVQGNVWYKTEVNGASLSQGVYIYRISNGHQVINEKLILNK